ncbi:STAS domain-containing protein [Actinoplanes utahensis]|nr:STAS domain-containing protein [Actinoplanes utahensis]
MTDPHYEIQRTRGRTGITVHLHLSGAFDRDAGRVLRTAMRDTFASGRRGLRVFVDVSAVESIGSECIDLLLVGYTRALRAGHGYEIVNAHGHIRQALALTGLCEPETLYAPDDWTGDLIGTPTPYSV